MLSALSLSRSAAGAGGLLLLLRAGGVLALPDGGAAADARAATDRPRPNHVAVLVDASRSMDVRPPDGGPSRAERAAALLQRAAPRAPRWEQAGHRVDLYTFGEGAGAGHRRVAGARRRSADATRMGEALAELRARYAGHDLGAVVLLSDGIDTGRIGEGPLDAATRAAIEALGAPVHTVGVGEKSLRDLSVAAVLADEFAFVRTPVTIEAVMRQTRPARPADRRDADPRRAPDGHAAAWCCAGDRSEEQVSFDWVPDHPGNFVFQIATPVLAGEALASNNSQVFTVKVIRDRVRVLHVCGRPSWDERFLRAMLRRDPNVDLVSFFILRTETDEQPWNRNELSLIPFPTYEIFEEQLHSFDLVIFQNFNYAPYGVEPFLPGVRDYVEEGGALAMIGGDLSFASGGYAHDAAARRAAGRAAAERARLSVGASDADLTVDAFRPKLTPEGRTHPVTSLLLDPRENEARWGKLPALEGFNRVQRVRAGRRHAAGAPDAADRRRQAGARAGGRRARARGRSLALLTDTRLALGLPVGGRRRRRPRLPALLGERHPLAGARPGADVAAHRARPRRVPPQPAAVGARARRAPRLLAGAEGRCRGRRSCAADGDPQGRPLKRLEATTNTDGEAHVELGTLAPGAYRVVGTPRWTAARSPRTRRSWCGPRGASWKMWRSATASSRRSQTSAAAAIAWGISAMYPSKRRARCGSDASDPSSCGRARCSSSSVCCC